VDSILADPRSARPKSFGVLFVGFAVVGFAVAGFAVVGFAVVCLVVGDDAVGVAVGAVVGFGVAAWAAKKGWTHIGESERTPSNGTTMDKLKRAYVLLRHNVGPSLSTDIQQQQWIVIDVCNVKDCGIAGTRRVDCWAGGRQSVVTYRIQQWIGIVMPDGIEMPSVPL